MHRSSNLESTKGIAHVNGEIGAVHQWVERRASDCDVLQSDIKKRDS